MDSWHRIDFFEKSAPYYDTILNLLTFGQYPGFQKRAMEVLAPKPGEKILDLCSGTGRVASWMAHAVGSDGEVVGMDISKNMVEWSKKRYDGLNKVMFLCQDVTKPWEYQNYFDGIFTSFAIHELPEKKRLAAFEHSYLALKEKGRILIADFNPQISGNSKTISLIFFKLFERDNLNFFSFDQNEVLKRVGFKRIKTFPVLGGIFQITLAHRSADYSECQKKVVIACGRQARSEATCLHAEVVLRLPARSRFGEGRARRRGNLMRLLHFVRNDSVGMSTYLWRSL